MELRQLRAFCTVAELGSFTRAARSLGYAQPTITTQVQMLEMELGQRLLDRVGRRVRLTEPGAVLQPYAERMLALNDEALKALAGLSRPQGNLSVAATESICSLRLAPVLAAYTDVCADVRVTLRTGTVPELLASVLDHRSDVALVAGPIAHGEQLVCEPLFEEPLALVCSPRYAARGAIDLASAPLLGLAAGSGYHERLAALRLGEQRDAGAVMEFASLECARAGALAGLGVALLPLLAVAADLSDGRLRRLEPPSGEALNLPIVLIRNRTSYVTPALRRFIEVVQAQLKPAGVEQTAA